MKNMRWLIPGFVVAITFAACDSKDNLLSVKDGAVDTRNGMGGGLGGSGTGGTSGQGGATGRGGAASGGMSGSGGVVGSGGLTSTRVTGRGGSGAVAGNPGTGGLGTGGGGGSTKTDGAIADAANDAPLRSDGGDAVVATTDGGAALDTGAPACSALTIEADCRARSDCHAIYGYQDPTVCGCATVDCCVLFSRCIAGKPDCVPPEQFSCTIAQPYCAGDYVLSYVGGCFEGCVLGTDCSGLSSCSPAPQCGVDEVSVRVHWPDLGETQCACEPNPCPSSLLPTCDCAAELCTKYPGVSCVGYMPGSGQLVCAEQG
jgi:hypothetical protein